MNPRLSWALIIMIGIPALALAQEPVENTETTKQVEQEVERCLNCDMQTVFFASECIECDACLDICPTQCLTMTPNAEKIDILKQLKAPRINHEQPLFVSEELKQTKRVMVKDENLCIHCSLCAERCPTAAWDMQKSLFNFPRAADYNG